jgi:hypothetical protein
MQRNSKEKHVSIDGSTSIVSIISFSDRGMTLVNGAVAIQQLSVGVLRGGAYAGSPVTTRTSIHPQRPIKIGPMYVLRMNSLTPK